MGKSSGRNTTYEQLCAYNQSSSDPLNSLLFHVSIVTFVPEKFLPIVNILTAAATQSDKIPVESRL